jgi:hypothetical protein
VDVSKGIYMSFGCVFRAEGADEEALKAATNYVKACQSMGGVWAKYNKMTKRMEWLYMRQEVHEIFEESWRLYEESEQIKDKTAGDDASGKGVAIPSTGSGKVPKAKARAKAESADKNKDPEQKTTPTKDTKRTPFDTAMMSAQVTKKTFMTVASRANLVMDNIANNEDWVWARGHYGDMLAKTMAPINTTASTGFPREFLMHELREIKSKYTQFELLPHSIQFTLDLDKPLDAAAKLITKLISMQSEAMK